VGVYPEWLTTISACEHCHFEKIRDDLWKWRCDAVHPEVIAQLREWEAAQKRARDEEEDEFWQ